MERENIYIGKKPVLNYVTALVTALQKSDTVDVKARGRNISIAVDVVEVTKRSFVTDLKYVEIKCGTEKLGDPNNLRNVSTMTITVSKA